MTITRACVIAASLLLLTAAGKSSQDRAEAEAKSWLKPCPEADQAKQMACLDLQRRFVENYPDTAVDPYSLSYVIDPLDPRPASPELGIRHDKVEACAFRLTRAQVIRALGWTGEAGAWWDVNIACGDLDQKTKTAIYARDRAILQRTGYWPPPATPFAAISGFPAASPPGKSLTSNP